MPAFGSTLPEITKASGTVTMEMIEEAKAFLQTNEYSAWAANYGNAVAYSAPLLMWTITIPKKFNGLFILPILSAVSQFFTSKFMNAGQQSSNAQQASTNKFMQWFFPLFSLWICAGYNAAFAIYWMAANVIQVVQQLAVNWYFDRQDRKKALEEAAKETIE